MGSFASCVLFSFPSDIFTFNSQFLNIREFHGVPENLFESILYELRNSEGLHCNHFEAITSISKNELGISPGPDTKQGVTTFSGGEFNPDC